MSAKDALARKKLRVNWGPVGADTDRDALLEAVFSAVCALQPTRPGDSQDELLQFTSAAPGPDGLEVGLMWLFDRDYASAIDQTESRAGVLVVGPGGARVRSWE